MLLIVIHVYVSVYYLPRLVCHEYIRSEISPDGQYSLDLWFSRGNATTDFCVAATIRSINGGFRKNLYQSYHSLNITGEWLDDNIVMINDTVLDVRYDTFTNTRFYGTSAKATLPRWARFMNGFFRWILRPLVPDVEH